MLGPGNGMAIWIIFAFCRYFGLDLFLRRIWWSVESGVVVFRRR